MYSAVSAKPPRYLRHAFVELPRPLLAEHLVQVVHALVEDAVGLAGVHFVGPKRVGHFVHHVAAVQRVEDAQEEVEVHLQAGFGVGLVQAAATAGTAARGSRRSPALRSARRYSASYMPKRQGPQAPAVKKT